MTNQIYPCLWFDGNAKEAEDFYCSVFKDAKILRVSHYGEGAPAPAGTVSSVEFRLNGQNFIALNGGPAYKFTPAISMFINCESQEEIDYFWDKLLEGGRMDRCGWLQDKWGVSWQIIPDALMQYLGSPDREKANRALQAMLKMKKIIVADLDKAFNG